MKKDDWDENMEFLYEKDSRKTIAHDCTTAGNIAGEVTCTFIVGLIDDFAEKGYTAAD